MNQKLIKRFKRFLKEEGLYTLFKKRYNPEYNLELKRFGLRYVSLYGKEDEMLSLEEYMEGVEPIRAIMGAFSWSNLEEGFHFWAHVHYKWINIIKQYPKYD